MSFLDDVRLVPRELEQYYRESASGIPHLAEMIKELDDLDKALKGNELLIEPNAPSDGVRVAFIPHDGAPAELLEFRAPDGIHT